MTVRRVLAVHPSPDLYGADLMLVRSLQAMSAAGLDVQLMVPEEGPLLERLAAAAISVQVQRFPVLRKALLRPLSLLWLGIRLPWDLAVLVRRIRVVAPDALYVNTLTLPHWILAGRLAGVPVICHVRELEDQLPLAMNRGLTAPLLLATDLVANSRATANYLARCWIRLRRTTRVVYNGLDFPEVQTRDVPHGAARITLVGRLNPRKGQDVALEAVKLLVDEGRKVELELVGSAFRGYEWYPQELQDTAASMGLSDQLLLAGFQESVWDSMQAADIVIVPSRVEPFGGVAVEAMATAAPVVVSRVGGLPEIVDSGRTGLVVEPGDAPALATALATLLDDPDRALAMGRAASAEVRVRFARERYEREMVELVCSVVGIATPEVVIDLRDRVLDLTDSDVTDSDLTDSDLTDSDLTDSDLTDSDLTDSEHSTAIA